MNQQQVDFSPLDMIISNNHEYRKNGEYRKKESEMDDSETLAAVPFPGKTGLTLSPV